MTNFFGGNAVIFLSIWVLVYALILFGMSIASERRRTRQTREGATKNSTSFLLEPSLKSNSGRRASPRREGNPTPVLVADKDGPEWLTGACVVNRSEGGLRLTFSQPYDMGKKLRVLSSHAPSNILFADVEVRNCRRGTNGYELGCRFAYAHPLNVVLLFG
jgi:hypothetical protein